MKYSVKIRGKKLILRSLFNKLQPLVGSKTGIGTIISVSRTKIENDDFVEIVFKGSFIRKAIFRKIVKEIKSINIEES